MPKDVTASLGMPLHVSDVLLEELQRAAEPGPIPARACRTLLQVVATALPRANHAMWRRLR